jgi:hypothetical protein
VTIGIGRVLPSVVVGLVLAAACAVALSPLFPIEPVHEAEPEPGVRVDPVVLVVGSVALGTVLLGAAGVAAWRVTRVAATRPRRAPVRARLGASFGPVASNGTRLVLEPSTGGTRVPVRSTLVYGVVGTAVVVAALVVGANLRHLLETPRLYGYSWDVMLGDGFGDASFPDAAVRAVGDDELIAATAAGGIGDVEINGRSVGALGTDVIDGEIGPSIIHGRAAAGDDEIALGTQTMDALDVAIGDTVSVTSGTTALELRVVGRAALPQVNDITSVDDGAAVTFATLRTLRPDEPRNVALFRLAADVEPADLAEQIPTLLGPYADDFGVSEEALRDVTVEDLQPPTPTDLVDLGRIDRMPLLLAAGASFVAVAMLVHLLVSAVRARRRDLALLAVLGFTRRQVFGTVSWQASVLAAVAVVIGVPLGVALGRWLWRAYAEEVGVVPEQVVPLAVLAVAAAAAVLIANVAAVLSTWRLVRTAPATLLRSE